MTCKPIKPAGCGRKKNSCSSPAGKFRYSNDYTPLETLHDQVYGDRDGKIHPHQHRIGSDILDEAIKTLADAGFDNKGQYFENVNHMIFADFEKLHDFIEEKLEKINGIGDLTIYDIAVRIGWHQNPRVLPKDYVYIHAGTEVGAEKVLGRKINKKRRPITDFANIPVLNGMNALEIEDYLCIYKNKL